MTGVWSRFGLRNLHYERIVGRERTVWGDDVPLDDGDLSIASDQNRGSDHLVIDVSYAKPIQLVPGYEYVWPFSFTIDTIYSKRF